MKELEVGKALSFYTKPENVIFVISGTYESPNIMPAGWSMRTSFTPPLFAVSIGLERYTHDLIMKYREFVISFPSEKNERLILKTGGCSGRDVDKFEEFKIKNIKRAEKVNLPLLVDSFINLECTLESFHDTGDHTIFVGRVLKAWKGEGEEVVLNMGKMKFKTFKPNL